MSDKIKPIAFPYPEDPGKTHFDGCWAWSGHHNCAVAKIYELEQGQSQKQKTREELTEMSLVDMSERQIMEMVDTLPSPAIELINHFYMKMAELKKGEE